MQVPDRSIRYINRQFIEQDEGCHNAISEMRRIEAFLDDFGTLSLGRDFVLCGKYVFSLRMVSAACELTVGSIISCCKAGCMADANSLLRKYRDDLFFYLYVMICDSGKQSDSKSSAVIKMEENIENWINDGLRDLSISAVLQAIGRSPRVKDAVQRYNLQKYFDDLRDRLNNFVHSNGVSFYNQCVYAYRGTGLQQQMQDLLKDMRLITITFLFLLALCSPFSISATDYVDYLECQLTPSAGSEYWVAPFIAEFFENNSELIDDSCLKYLKDKTTMEL